MKRGSSSSSSSSSRLENGNPAGSSLYPHHPGRTIFRIPQSDLTNFDRAAVIASSLFIVGSIVWVPVLYTWAWRSYQKIPKADKRRRTIYATLVLASVVALYAGPHKNPRVGEWLRLRKWKLWSSWLRFIAMEVIADRNDDDVNEDECSNKAARNDELLAFVPHGIFPFAFAFGAMPELAKQAFGVFRPVTATAVNVLPMLRLFLSWLNQIDASRPSVNRALARGDRLGIIPGGIQEIFEGYPKKGTRPDEEYAIVGKGFLRMALQYGVSVVPIYCFGSTKMFRRLDLPVLEKLSSIIRTSIVLFFGVSGLPIPFRQKLLYVIGNPVVPPTDGGGGGDHNLDEAAIGRMHEQFCDELVRIFDRHKEAYGWGHKTLKILSR